MGRVTPNIVIKDGFRPLPEYCVDPLTITAVGLKLGQDAMDKAILKAKERGVREFAIIGDCAIHVALRPAKDSWPPEHWMHEFVKPKYLARARSYIDD